MSKRMKMSFVVFFQNLSIECSALVYFSNFAIIRAFRFVFRLNSLGCSIVVARYYHCIRIFIALSLACASDILFAIWKFIKHMIRDLFVYLHFERISFAICVCVCLCVCAVAQPRALVHTIQQTAFEQVNAAERKQLNGQLKMYTFPTE